MKRHLLAVFLTLTSVVAQGGTVTLVSSEGEKCVLEESVASLSGFIAANMNFDPTVLAEGDAKKAIKFQEISTECLATIVEDISHLHSWYTQHPSSLEHRNDNNNREYVAATQERTYDIEKTLVLLKTADFLQAPELIHRYARDIAKQGYESPITTFNNLHGNTCQAAEEVVAPYLKQHMFNELFSVASPKSTVIRHDNWVTSAAFSPDGTKVVTGSYDGTARVSDAQTGAQIAVMAHLLGADSVAFSPDGTKVITVSLYGPARVSDAQTGAQIAEIRHREAVLLGAFSPDGTKVLTGLGEGTVCVSDVQTGKQSAVIRHCGMVFSAAFSPDGTKVVTRSSNTTALITHFPLAEITDFKKLLAVLISHRISLDTIDEQVREEIKSVLDTLTKRQQAALGLSRRKTENKHCNIL